MSPNVSSQKARSAPPGRSSTRLRSSSSTAISSGAGTMMLPFGGVDLRAIDGSTLRLPDTPEAIARFGQMFPAHSDPATLARISQVYDPLNGLILDAIIAPYQQDERELLVEHLAALEAGSLLLLDCGYPAFWVFAALQTRKLGWCARVALDTWSVVRDFLAAGRDDAVVTLIPHGEAQAPCRSRGLPTTAIPVRLIRVPLPSGTVEILMTSLLNRDDHPAEAFAPLYHLRWAQEENYKCFKCRVEVENWSGKSSLAIRQDFHAKIFTLNLTAVLTHTAQQQVDEQHGGDSHPKQVNLTHALCAMKGTLVRLLTRSPGTAARLDRRLCPYRRAGSPETALSKTQRPPRVSHDLQA